MNIRMQSVALASLVMALAAGCSHQPVTPTSAAVPQPLREAKPAAEAAPASQMEYATLKGKVVEATDGGRNTFVLVDTGAASRWAVIPKAPVSVGQQVELRKGMVVTKYFSKAQNKTYDSIVFSPGLAGKETAEMDMNTHLHPWAGKTSTKAEQP